MLTLPTFPSSVDPTVQRALRDIVAALNALEAQYTNLQIQLRARQSPLTLAEIQQGLSSTGAAPLNLTGLIGAATTPAVVGP